ncbi:hypothetical protein KC221_26150, partial [Mycobacterium tuberculosis]|nr:hypothetical protein [Mycobacterium tuberculosis]
PPEAAPPRHNTQTTTRRPCSHTTRRPPTLLNDTATTEINTVPAAHETGLSMACLPVRGARRS